MDEIEQLRQKYGVKPLLNNVQSSQNAVSELDAAWKPEVKFLTEDGVGSLPGFKQATELGVGIGTELGKAGIGLGETFLKGAGKIGEGLDSLFGQTPEKDRYAPVIDQMENIKENVYEKPFVKEKDTLMGKTGSLIGKAAPFIATGGGVKAGQEFLAGATKGLGQGLPGVPYLIQKFAQVVPEMAVTGGTEYAVTGGDEKSAKIAAVTAGIFSTLTHVGSDIFRKLIPQDVKTNVMNSLGIRGKTTLQGATGKKADDAVDAYTTISRMSKDIEVIDKNGVSKKFNPVRADYIEMPQALQQTKNKIYEAYTGLAKKAGENGAEFTPDDFSTVIDDLKKYEEAGYTGAYTQKANQIIEALNRFGKMTKEGVEFSPTDFTQIQKVVESINTDVNPLSDKAGAKVALEASSKIREILDNKITGATGEEYQQLRTAYAQLKSIEADIINNYKKALRSQGVAKDVVDGISTVDAIQGILTGEHNLTLRGALIHGTKKVFSYLRDPEVAMQRAFKLINEGGDQVGGRLTGPAAEGTGFYKAGQEVQKSFGDYIKDPKMGLSIDNIAKNITSAEKGTLRDFTDLVNGAIKSKDKIYIENLKRDAQDIAEKYGFDKVFAGDKSLSNQIGQYLDSVNFDKKIIK